MYIDSVKVKFNIFTISMIICVSVSFCYATCHLKIKGLERATIYLLTIL